MSASPELPDQPTFPGHPGDFDYEHLVTLMAERLAVDVTNSVANLVTTQVADLLTSGSGVGPRRYP